MLRHNALPVGIRGTGGSRVTSCTLHLLSKEQMQGRLLDELWKVHFIDGNVSRGIESLLANEDSGLIRLVCKKAKGGTPSVVRASLKRAKIRIDFPVPAIRATSPDVWLQFNEALTQALDILARSSDFDFAIENPRTLGFLRKLIGEDITFEEFLAMIRE